MLLTIVLRKEVDDEQTAQQIFNIVKQRLEDYPDVTVSGQVNSQLLNGTEEP